ncbi:MAG: CDP-glucose 4,6-dehydratase, partial [Nevskiales bacterium]
PSVRAAVMITSDKCYENREWAWGYRENEAMGGHDPYASSKGCAELVSAAYRRSFLADARVAVATARAGNVIGGGDWAADRLVPDLMRAFGGGQPVILRHPEAVRPWQHVLEPLAGYLLLAERLSGSEDGASYANGWNFGPADSDARTVLDIVSTAARHWGEGAAWQIDAEAQQVHEAQTLKLDSSLARQRLGWQSRLNLDQALAWTVEWYQAQLSGQDMLALSTAQIERYRELPS